MLRSIEQVRPGTIYHRTGIIEVDRMGTGHLTVKLELQPMGPFCSNLTWTIS